MCKIVKGALDAGLTSMQKNIYFRRQAVSGLVLQPVGQLSCPSVDKYCYLECGEAAIWPRCKTTHTCSHTQRQLPPTMIHVCKPWTIFMTVSTIVLSRLQLSTFLSDDGVFFILTK